MLTLYILVLDEELTPALSVYGVLAHLVDVVLVQDGELTLVLPVNDVLVHLVDVVLVLVEKNTACTPG